MSYDDRVLLLAIAGRLAEILGGRIRDHLKKAERARAALIRWYGSTGPHSWLDAMSGKVWGKAYVLIKPPAWKTAKCRTHDERMAEVLGFVSGRTGPWKGYGRYRPHILLVPGKKPRKRAKPKT